MVAWWKLSAKACQAQHWWAEIGFMLRFVDIAAIIAFMLLSAPIVAGLVTTLFAAAYFMVFSEAPLEEAQVLAPFFLTVATFVYGTLCWHVFKEGS